MRLHTFTFFCLAVLVSSSASAQSPNPRPAPAAEFTAGYAGFADEGTIGHGVFGGAVRFHLTPRISVGPEVQFMVGPQSDRDLILTGNVTFDLLPRSSQVVPFFVVGGGLFTHWDNFSGQSYASTEGAFTGGGGVRAWVSDRAYVAGEVRVGWELHYRLSGTVGIALGR